MSSRPEPADPWQPCGCAEARLLREWLTNPWALPDPDQWPIVWLLSEQIAIHRLRALSHDLAAAGDWGRLARRPSFAELQRRRYPPDGDLHRHVAHGERPCPRPPCWCYEPPPCRYPACRRDVCLAGDPGHPNTHHPDPVVAH